MREFEIKEKEFNHISSMVHELCGINLHVGKKELVKSRLSKRLRSLGINDFGEYIKYIENDISKDEFTTMVDLLSTNLTSFYRENNHFNYVAKILIPDWNQNLKDREIKIWSAGCSSGEEPYTLAIVVKEAGNILKSKDVKILATDISTRMLDTAKSGIYTEERLKNIPMDIRRKYFLKGSDKLSKYYSVKPDLKELIGFGRLNLLGDWPMTSRFDLIFCRNVMIYFDKPTQGKLVNRFWNILKPGGILMVGHSESLTGITHNFKYVQPTIYRKI